MLANLPYFENMEIVGFKLQKPLVVNTPEAQPTYLSDRLLSVWFHSRLYIQFIGPRYPTDNEKFNFV